MRWSLSLGSRISILAVLISMPRKVKTVEGPSNFSTANGMPSSAQVFIKISKLLLQVVEAGGSIVRKSSK